MSAQHYTASNGKIHVITEMADGHIHNALAKLERDHPHRTDEITAMRAEVAKREEQSQ